MQFGGGGAGTFSDGKLWTQVKDPKHYGRKVLGGVRQGRCAGGNPLRQQAAHRHFRLVKMVEHIRATIESLGGEFRFQHKVVDLVLEEQPNATDPARTRRIRGVVLDNGETLTADQVILAIGHSARDTFKMLHERGVYIEPKPFSIGFRIEHPQGLIDRTLRAERRQRDPRRCGLQSWFITRRTVARSTASACARRHGGRRHRKKAVWSPTA